MSLITPTAISNLKILCLHGYRQNKEIFWKKTGGLRRLIKNYAKCEFINAPHVVPLDDGIFLKEENDTTETDVETDTYAWWLMVKDKESESLICNGVEESVKLIEKTFEEKGPFDGILGFSQGATFAGYLSILLEEKRLKAQFRFVIIIAGAHSLREPLSQYSETLVNIPSLHIMGESDQIVSKERSEKFLQCFTSACHATHPGGHHVPTNSALKNIYRGFIEKQILNEDVKHEANVPDH